VPEPTALALLRIEVDTLWTRDANGRLDRVRVTWKQIAAPYLTVVSGGGGHFAEVSNAVPVDVARDLADMVDAHAVDPATGVPEIADVLRGRVDREMGPTTIGGGPSYVVPAGASYDSGAVIETSTDQDAEALRGRMPDDDVDGTGGPWAVAVVDGTVAAMCSTSRRTELGVEAGLWTYAGFRGRGHAAAATAAWAALFSDAVVRFYSTAFTNRSSQRVTERLGLPRLGWTWQLHAAP
jgi:hypothetical protein